MFNKFDFITILENSRFIGLLLQFTVIFAHFGGNSL